MRSQFLQNISHCYFSQKLNFFLNIYLLNFLFKDLKQLVIIYQ